MRDMKKLHQKIDIISAALFLYCCGVLLALAASSLMGNNAIRAALSLCLPFLFCRTRLVLAFNQLIHAVFGFDR